MKREPVKSSNIVSVGYDSAEKAMEVEFKSGGVYRYNGVPAHIHQEFVGADSIGSHFHKHIRSNFTGINLTER